MVRYFVSKSHMKLEKILLSEAAVVVSEVIVVKVCITLGS